MRKVVNPGGLPSKAIVRCAIYTRVSTDNGLDQEFNSLDAQREASSAYIKNQAHAGWVEVKTRYDDGGFSGGSTDRPALQNLLEDVRAHRIDIIVVYKVDRLTRLLAEVGSVPRVPAHEVEERIRTIILEPRLPAKNAVTIDSAVASNIIERIEVRKSQLVVQLKQAPGEDGTAEDDLTLIIPWTKPPSRIARSILHPTSVKLPLRPMKLERRATVVAAIARGRRWLANWLRTQPKMRNR